MKSTTSARARPGSGPNARLIEELAAALQGMFTASEEIAVEFIEHKRATNWGVVNDAYVLSLIHISEPTRPY